MSPLTGLGLTSQANLSPFNHYRFLPEQFQSMDMSTINLLKIGDIFQPKFLHLLILSG